MSPLAAVPPQGAAWLRALLHHPAAILFTLDPAGRIQWVSPQVKPILGLDPEALAGQRAIAGLAEAHQATAESHARAKREGREEEATYETMLRAADGREVWLELTSHAERDAAGALVAVHGLAIDVTRHRQARAALERSRQRLADILQDANDVVYLHDLEGRFLTVNQAAIATYGYTEAELMHMSVRDLVDAAHLPRVAEEIRLKVEGKKRSSAPYELLTRAKDGRPVWVAPAKIPCFGAVAEADGIGRGHPHSRPVTAGSGHGARGVQGGAAPPAPWIRARNGSGLVGGASRRRAGAGRLIPFRAMPGAARRRRGGRSRGTAPAGRGRGRPGRRPWRRPCGRAWRAAPPSAARPTPRGRRLRGS